MLEETRAAASVLAVDSDGLQMRWSTHYTCAYDLDVVLNAAQRSPEGAG